MIPHHVLDVFMLEVEGESINHASMPPQIHRGAPLAALGSDSFADCWSH